MPHPLRDSALANQADLQLGQRRHLQVHPALYLHRPLERVRLCAFPLSNFTLRIGGARRAGFKSVSDSNYVRLAAGSARTAFTRVARRERRHHRGAARSARLARKAEVGARRF